MADNDVTKMKVADLKRELKMKGLLTTGNKNELVERLQSAIIEGDVFDDTGISEELLDEGDDVLNDDELDDELEDTKLFDTSPHDEDAILKSPQGSPTSESSNGRSIDIASAVPQQKKIVLKRKLATSFSLNESDSIKEISSVSDSKIVKIDNTNDDNHSNDGANGNGDTSTDDKNVVKLSKLTMKERLDLRAKKFGAPVSVDVLKVARAERFGTTTTAAKSTTSPSKDKSEKITAVSAPVSVEVLKKRAERFGGSVSQVMNTIENKEKLLKRQERFGAASTTTVAKEPIDTKTASAFAEKAKLRLERFKTSVK